MTPKWLGFRVMIIMRCFKISRSIVFLSTIFAFVSGETNAGFVWTIDDNAGHSVNLNDTGSTGQITFNGTVGAYTISGTAYSKPLVGSATNGIMKFAPLQISTSGAVAAPLTIKLTDTDFPSTSAGRDGLSWIGSIANGSVTGDAYFDPANINFGTGGLHLALATVTATSSPVSLNYGSGFQDFNYGQVQFSEFIELDVNATGALNLGLTEMQSPQIPIPEPSGLVIAGIGGVFLAFHQIFRQRLSVSIVTE